MRSLFFKIFLWFWAAQVLIGAALYLLAVASRRTYDDRLTDMVGANLAGRAKAAAIAYESGGLPALQEAWRLPPGRSGRTKWLAEPIPPLPVPLSPADVSLSSFYILRGSTKSPIPIRLAGPPQVTIFARFAPPTLSQGMHPAGRDNSAVWLARRVNTPRGGHYMAVRLLHYPRGRSGGLWNPWLPPGPNLSGWWRLLVIALIMGGVCYALARYLADPAIKLSQATREFAGGNMATRIGPQMGRRRDELADLGRDFDIMAERIESLRRSEQRLLGDISHELRSPLSRIQVALDLAERSADPQTRGYLLRIEEEAAELNDMIAQLLTITRLETGAPDYPKDDVFDLDTIVAEVCADADFEAGSRGGEVRLVAHTPCRMQGNATLLRSAIENVVRNAVIHAAGYGPIEVSQTVETHCVLISVRDHGPGVPDDSLHALFRPFYRVAEGRERQSGGVGLGLSIAQRSVELHGGTISAHNADGGGLLVLFELPIN